MDASKEKNKVMKPNKEKELEKIKNSINFEKKKKNKKLIIIVVLIILIIFSLLFSVIFALIQKGKNTIAKGVSARGIELSNLTYEEAKNTLITALNKETETPIKLKYEDYYLDINLSEIEFKYDVNSILNEAYQIGRDDNIIKNNYCILGTMLNGKELELKYSYNKDALTKIVETIDTSIPGKVTEYTYCIEEDELIITPGKDGLAVNTIELEKLIVEAILKRDESYKDKDFQEINIPVANKKADNINLEKIYNEIYCEPKDAELIEEPFQLVKDEDGIDFAITMEEAKALITGDKDEYSIPLKITKANKTVASLGSKVFPQVLSQYSTNYNPGATARTKNLQIAASKINGTVLMPGEEFSFNRVVGKRTVQDGYQNAPIYENGKVVDGLAGGICQISSTLYNAALLANLEITDRRNHNFTSTYVPEGRDATVVYGAIDFKFKNSRQYPIQLNASVSGGVATFVIKGIKEETEYDVKIVTNITATIPFTEKIEEDSSLAPGTTQVIQAGHNGCKVSSYRVLYLNGNEVSRKLLYNDTYKAMERIVKVGGEATQQEPQEETRTPVIEDLSTPPAEVESNNNGSQNQNTTPAPTPTPTKPAEPTPPAKDESNNNGSQNQNTTPAPTKPAEQTPPAKDESTNTGDQSNLPAPTTPTAPTPSVTQNPEDLPAIIEPENTTP